MTITANDTEFLNTVLAGIDAWFADDSNLDELDHSRDLIRQRINQLATQPSEPDIAPREGSQMHAVTVSLGHDDLSAAANEITETGWCTWVGVDQVTGKDVEIKLESLS